MNPKLSFCQLEYRMLRHIAVLIKISCRNFIKTSFIVQVLKGKKYDE